jgi:hypothetical protein
VNISIIEGETFMDREKLIFYALKIDLIIIEVFTDFVLTLKDYSKSYNGRYNPNNQEVIVYLYEDEKCTKLRPYGELLKTAIHESVHHYQWCHDDNFHRTKGVMHNPEFLELENKWVEKADNLGLLRRKL